jgi:hypothetical protein
MMPLPLSEPLRVPTYIFALSQCLRVTFAHV